MKILVVDDERPIREWLSMILLKITSYVDCVVTAVNGREAFQRYLTEDPDLIITDIKMPVMSGLELMEEVKKRDAEMPFIILTCHEEFAYARKALQMGAQEYLLKTDIHEGQLVEVLEKIGDIKKGREVGEDVFFIRQRFVVDVLEHNLFPTKEIVEKIGIYKSGKNYFVMALRTSEDCNITELEERFISEEYIREYLPYDKNILFVIIWVEKNSSFLTQLNQIQKFAAVTYSQVGTMHGFSRMYEDPEQFGVAFRQALHQMNQGFYNRKRGAIRWDTNQKDNFFDFEKETAEVLSDIIFNGRNCISEKIERWMEQIERYASTDSGQLKIGCLRVLERLKDKYKGVDFDKKDVVEANSFIQIKECFQDVLENLRNPESVHGSVYISQAIEYVEHHYGENCGLEQIAMQVGLNADYFSRVFKQEMKQNYNTFLTNYRIEIAKRMLMETQESITDIAEKVGYQNLAYFSRVFKKNTGHTPFEYRK